MMKKRFFAGFLALMLLFSLAACGEAPEEVSSSGSDSGAGETGSFSDTDFLFDSSETLSDGTDADTDGTGVTDSASEEVSSDEEADAEDGDLPSDGDEVSGEEDAPPPTGGNGDNGVDVDYDTGNDPRPQEPSQDNNSGNSGNTGNTGNSGNTGNTGNSSQNTASVGLSGLMAMTDQRNGAIVVVDLSCEDITSQEAVVWEWTPRMYGDITNYNASKSERLDAVTLREVHGGLFNGTVVGVTSSSGLIAVVEYPSGKCLFSLNAAGYGPHDIDILPNGLVAVACSGNGNESKSVIRVYRAKTKTDSTCAEVAINSGHGVLWDPQKEVLWALGGNVLKSYEVSGSPSVKPTLKEVSSLGGFTGGHNLSPVYGNPDRMWISGGSSVFQYSKSQNKLVSDYTGLDRISSSAVKSVNSYANGTVIWSVADPNNQTANHNTDTLRILYYRSSPSGALVLDYKTVKFANRDFYKVRVFDAAYQ